MGCFKAEGEATQVCLMLVYTPFRPVHMGCSWIHVPRKMTCDAALAQVTFKGDGPLGGIQVIADALGNVKGKVGNPEADPPLRPNGKLNVGAAVGRGAVPSYSRKGPLGRGR